MSDSGRVIPVEIFGQRYPIRTTLDPEYVSRLANYVEEKMRAAGDSTPSADPQRLAVLAALNVADELFQARGRLRGIDEQVRHRVEGLARELKVALGD